MSNLAKVVTDTVTYDKNPRLQDMAIPSGTELWKGTTQLINGGELGTISEVSRSRKALCILKLASLTLISVRHRS